MASRRITISVSEDLYAEMQGHIKEHGKINISRLTQEAIRERIDRDTRWALYKYGTATPKEFLKT